MAKLGCFSSTLFFLFSLFTGCLTSPVWAQDIKESQYIAERNVMQAALRAMDDYNSKLKSPVLDAFILKQDTKAIASLQTKLEDIIGVIEIEGMKYLSSMSPAGLLADIGSDSLDSLYYGKDNAKLLQVSTESLLQHWLEEYQRKFATGQAASFIPQHMEQVLVTDSFYTFAISSDATVQTVLRLPIRQRPEAKIVFAALSSRTQDAPVSDPDRIIIGAVQGGLVYLAEIPLKTRFSQIKSCLAVLGDEIDERFIACFSAHVKKQPAYAAAVAQAQAFYDSLPVAVQKK